jgi:hypothetical protein
MVTFWQIMEQMAAAVPEDESVEAVRSGMNIRPDFWDDFIRLTGNAAALSVLLDVPKDKISSWASHITEILDRIQQTDGESGRSKTLSTGNQDA